MTKQKKPVPWWDTPTFGLYAIICMVGFYAFVFFMLGIESFIR